MLADQIKQRRKALGLTQHQLAMVLHVSSGSVAMWETGKRQPDIVKLERLADFFNTSTDSLLGRTPSPDPYQEKYLRLSNKNKALVQSIVQRLVDLDEALRNLAKSAAPQNPNNPTPGNPSSNNSTPGNPAPNNQTPSIPHNHKEESAILPDFPAIGQPFPPAKSQEIQEAMEEAPLVTSVVAVGMPYLTSDQKPFPSTAVEQILDEDE